MTSTKVVRSAALIVFFLVACSNDPAETRPTASCSLPPRIEEPVGVPADFPRLEDMRLATAEVTPEFVSVAGHLESTVERLFESASEVVVDNGFEVINTDFEGFEAEIYFSRGSSIAGIVMMREGPCDGFVKANVLYDPLETRAGRKAVNKTRRLLEGSTPSPSTS